MTEAKNSGGITPAELLAGGLAASLIPAEEQENLGVSKKTEALIGTRSVVSAPDTATAPNAPKVESAAVERTSIKKDVTAKVPSTEVATTTFSLQSAAPEELHKRLRQDDPVRPDQWYRRALHMEATKRTLRRAELEESMRAMLPRPVTIVTIQPKGGGGKTPTTIGIASALGSARGGDVLAFDNNESRGTLADRVETNHDRNLGDVLNHIGWFLEDPAANCLSLDWLCHRQLAGFKVLGADHRLLANSMGISAEQFQQLHRVATRYNPIAVVDTGNNETAPNWRAAVGLADVLVVPIRMREDYLLPPARMLRGLQDQGYDLTNRVIVAVSNGGMSVRKEATAIAEEYFSAFPQINIPFDPVIDSEGPIRWSRLQEPTREAYRELGALALSMAIANASKPAGESTPPNGN